jgi:protein-S-isoprenylcysteine O-methyltransferase Ste14
LIERCGPITDTCCYPLDFVQHVLGIRGEGRGEGKELRKQRVARVSRISGKRSRTLEIVPIRGLGRFLPLTFLSLAAGLGVEFLGLFLAIWARRALGRNWSGEISIRVEHPLIRSGPYRRLKDPIYTGLLAMYVGTALVTRTWLAIVGVAIAAFAYWRKIRLEEKNLDVAFGAEYDAYRRETWALVPGVF